LEAKRLARLAETTRDLAAFDHDAAVDNDSSSGVGGGDSGTDSTNIGSTVGGVLGGLALVVVVGFVVWYATTRGQPQPAAATLSAFTINPNAKTQPTPAPQVGNLAEDANGYAIAVTSNPGYNYPVAANAMVGAGADANNGYAYDFPTAGAALDESNL
jgi:hypothetical protein